MMGWKEVVVAILWYHRFCFKVLLKILVMIADIQTCVFPKVNLYAATFLRKKMEK